MGSYYVPKIQGCTFISILQLGVQRGASIGGHAQSSKRIADGPINMANFFFFFKEKVVSPPTHHPWSN